MRNLSNLLFLPVLVLFTLVGCTDDDDSSPTQSQNHSPQISQVTANPSSLFIGESTNLGCVATDPDQDSLLYTWSCTFGDFPYGISGSSVVWEAPNEESDYNISVIVSDGASTDEENISVEVKIDTIPPEIPSSPYPLDNASLIPLDVVMSWSCNDPNGDPLTYSIYFGTSSNPNLAENTWHGNTYDPWSLANGVTYYWKIIAHDNHNNSTEGPVWNFTTVGDNPPNMPHSPNPQHNATNVSITVDLSWECSDPEGDPLTYYVYFDDSPYLSLVSSGQTNNYYDLGELFHNTTYYWKIMARDSHGNETTGPVWQFTTE